MFLALVACVPKFVDEFRYGDEAKMWEGFEGRCLGIPINFIKGIGRPIGI